MRNQALVAQTDTRTEDTASKINRHTDATASGRRLKRTDTPMTLQTVVAKSRMHRRTCAKARGEYRTHG